MVKKGELKEEVCRLGKRKEWVGVEVLSRGLKGSMLGVLGP